MSRFVVVHDPRSIPIRPEELPAVADAFRSGDVISEENARRWGPEGVLVLPVDPTALPALGATGARGATGYQRHNYGTGGVLFDAMRFSRGCPSAICLPSSVSRVEWMAYAIGGAGLLRLASDDSPGGHVTISDSATVPGLPMRGSAIVRGIEGSYATVCLAGACSGVRVAWFALTVMPA